MRGEQCRRKWDCCCSRYAARMSSRRGRWCGSTITHFGLSSSEAEEVCELRNARARGWRRGMLLLLLVGHESTRLVRSGETRAEKIACKAELRATTTPTCRRRRCCEGTVPSCVPSCPFAVRDNLVRGALEKLPHSTSPTTPCTVRVGWGGAHAGGVYTTPTHPQEAGVGKKKGARPHRPPRRPGPTVHPVCALHSDTSGQMFHRSEPST